MNISLDEGTFVPSLSAIEGDHFIGGQWVRTDSSDAFAVVNPYDQSTLKTLHNADDATVELAYQAARRAQHSWANTPPTERSRILFRIADLLRKHNEILSQIEAQNTGKPIQETRVADAASGADCFEFFASVAGSIRGESCQVDGNLIYTQRQPLGVCAAIGAWNYPIQIACWKAAPALAAGNALIFKPSEITPLTALLLAKLMQIAGLPDGLFNVLTGDGTIGKALAEHPHIDKISLTGSVPTGQKVMQGAAANLKSISLELGGKSPLIVCDDADLDSAVNAAMLANFYSNGQICSNGTRVFVQRGIYERFIEKLLATTQRIKLGNPLEDDTQMGPIISAKQASSISAMIQTGIDDGARLLCGGPDIERGASGQAHFIAPTIFTDVEDSMRIATDEIFGPVMSVLPFDDDNEVIERANQLPFGLAASVFSSNLGRAHQIVQQLDAGTCWINQYNLTPIEMPFGGVKQSGIGRENGLAALEAYTEIKSVYVNTGKVDTVY
ncbi:MAG: betaine-aldehyde dehydrogenase [Gammaproteobacteria bacterium]|nr:betaine-aldehyde dehydrogenase [Gammaproteobacteria bacterium]